jgi:hypothetical protein
MDVLMDETSLELQEIQCCMMQRIADNESILLFSFDRRSFQILVL